MNLRNPHPVHSSKERHACINLTLNELSCSYSLLCSALLCSLSLITSIIRYQMHVQFFLGNYASKVIYRHPYFAERKYLKFQSTIQQQRMEDLGFICVED